jgi:hypothetical protein
MSTKEITNSEDIIDSREVIERIDDLESTLDFEFEAWKANRALPEDDGGKEEESEFTLALQPECEMPVWAAAIACDPGHLYQDEATEFTVLSALAAEGEGCGDWAHGETLIRESYFEDYARQAAEDIGAIDPKAGWPLHCIDWEWAARELKMDYSGIDFDGVTYYVRS